jgi:hypothetical protein
MKSTDVCKQPGIAKPKWCPICKCFHDAAYKHKGAS